MLLALLTNIKYETLFVFFSKRKKRQFGLSNIYFCNQNMINMFHNNVETAMVAAITSFNASSAHIVQRRLKSKIFFNCTAGAASHYMSAI